MFPRYLPCLLCALVFLEGRKHGAKCKYSERGHALVNWAPLPRESVDLAIVLRVLQHQMLLMPSCADQPLLIVPLRCHSPTILIKRETSFV
jgi:hypothetical protein